MCSATYFIQCLLPNLLFVIPIYQAESFLSETDKYFLSRQVTKSSTLLILMLEYNIKFYFNFYFYKIEELIK